MNPTIHHVVIRERGPARDPARPLREQEGRDQHAAFMDRLADEGVIVRGGPLDGDGGALHIVAAADPEEIRTMLSQDPWERTVLRASRIARREIPLRAPRTAI